MFQYRIKTNYDEELGLISSETPILKDDVFNIDDTRYAVARRDFRVKTKYVSNTHETLECTLIVMEVDF